MTTRVLMIALTMSVLACVALPTLAAGVYRPYFLACDVEPSVYIWKEVFFLKPWGSNSPSTSYVEVSTWKGTKYCGRLVKISEYEIALSEGYGTRRSGQKAQDQVVVPKKDIIMAKIYW
ncbi:MAG: hypothetical protein JW952_04510 [Candidatus Eisenbacteria bacterium]|nr:hypothetical protein [Candidatus Eisenbacteria bacterium]